MMDEKMIKEIKIKNIEDIIEENLRIQNQGATQENPEEYHDLTEEDLNMEQLDLRDPEYGAKFLKSIRKILHREIRDWTLQPLQKKQTSYNRRINENFLFVYSEIQAFKKIIDGFDENVESNQDAIRSVNEKVESNQDAIRSVNEKVESNQDAIRSVNEKKVESNQDAIRSVNEKVESNQDAIRSVNEKVEIATLNIEKTIEEILQRKFISLRETFEIETIVKRSFLEVLKRYPRKEDLEFFVNEIKNGSMGVHDLEIKLRNTPEFKELQLWEHGCVYTKSGTKMYLDKNDTVISKNLAIKQIWESQETDILKDLIHDGMNIVDLGANIGYYTLLFSKWVGKTGVVFSFEPEANNFELLKKNLSANQVKNVKSFQNAVSNQNEKKFLYLAPENKGDHKIIEVDKNEDSKKILVDCVTLDSTDVSKYKIDLIKMDIQGSEMLALMGMANILKNNPKIMVFTEFWPYGIEKSGFSPKDFFDFFFESGFKVFLIEDKRLVQIEKDFGLLANYERDDYVNLLCKK
jgi:FkbM family methyltransferase